MISYYTYLECVHLLCNAHHLRELIYAAEQYEQVWPTQLIQCLLDIKIAVAEAANEGLSSLSEEQLKQFNEQYDEILAQGKAEIPILPAPKKKKRGKPKIRKRPSKIPLSLPLFLSISHLTNTTHIDHDPPVHLYQFS